MTFWLGIFFVIEKKIEILVKDCCIKSLKEENEREKAKKKKEKKRKEGKTQKIKRNYKEYEIIFVFCFYSFSEI